MDSDSGSALSLGETYLVTENGNERTGQSYILVILKLNHIDIV
jgi:hypothetical protein|tara:strand:- start:19 stop:147 length:129 start_codon:yes stop_codon:yes gene_type:complete